MDASTYSAMASAVSAGCALFTLYMFRAQGKGLVWTKDHVIQVLPDREGAVHIQIEIPLFNFGKGNIRFLRLRAKKINLATKAMENYEQEMDEAYFPEGVPIVKYRTAIQMHPNASKTNRLLIASQNIPDNIDLKEFQKKINESISQIPEHIVILKCYYKDGSWLGKATKETVIGLSVNGLEINFLSTTRRKELNEYFAW